MKKNRLFLIVVTIALTCGNLVAQNMKKKEKLTEEQLIEKQVQRIQENLRLDDETSAKFAPLYKAYIQEMKACHKEPDPNLKRESRTDEQIKAEIKEHLELRKKALDTQEKYFNEFQKILNARQLEIIFHPRHPKGQPMKRHKRLEKPERPPMGPQMHNAPAPEGIPAEPEKEIQD